MLITLSMALVCGCSYLKLKRPYQIGIASWYGPGYEGNRTASGEVFKMKKLTAAHNDLPFDSKVRVTNLKNGKQVTVKINDRGPFIPGRIIDLSYGAAKKIDTVRDGVVKVRIDIK